MRSLVLAGLLVAAVAAPASAKEDKATGASSAVTATRPLHSAGGSGVPDVTWTCTNTLSAAKEITIECRFVNASATAKTFVMCMMLDLKQAKQKAVPAITKASKKNYVLQPHTENGKTVMKCEPDTRHPGDAGYGRDTAYHLGCQLIKVPAKGEAKATFKGTAKFVPPPNVKVQANDFWINYADTINLTGKDVTIDEASCAQIIGQGQFLEPLKRKPVDSVTALWVGEKLPFTDPALAYQGLSFALPDDLWYSLFDDWPCAPPQLPEATPPQDACPAIPKARPPTTSDLNLYWFESAAEERDETYAARLRVRTRGPHAVRLAVTPRHRFVIHGQARRYGTITPCARAVQRRCTPVRVHEGARLRYEIDVRHNGRTRFDQDGVFVQDRVPPVVDSVQIDAGPGELRTIGVHARDKTTSPIAATLWYSIDGGANWTAGDLAPLSSPLLGGHARGFAGLAPGGPLRFYVAVQDEVYNDTWWGPFDSAHAPPSVAPMHAESSGDSTVYSADSQDPDDQFDWVIDVPGDPGCAAGFRPGDPEPDQATFGHAACSPDAAEHATITVTVSNADGRCTETFTGTASGDGSPADCEYGDRRVSLRPCVVPPSSPSPCCCAPAWASPWPRPST